MFANAWPDVRERGCSRPARVLRQGDGVRTRPAARDGGEWYQAPPGGAGLPAGGVIAWTNWTGKTTFYPLPPKRATSQGGNREKLVFPVSVVRLWRAAMLCTCRSKLFCEAPGLRVRVGGIPSPCYVCAASAGSQISPRWAFCLPARVWALRRVRNAPISHVLIRQRRLGFLPGG